MTPEDRERLKQIFEAAIDKPPEERQRFIEEACGGDQALLREIEYLVEHHERASDDFLNDPLIHPLLDTDEILTSTQEVGPFSIGALLLNRFRIVRFIGRGGMGDVYEAADLELRETVALKTIRASIAGNPRSLNRFKREIQLAKRVTDKHVCRIHDLFIQPQNGAEPAAAFLTMEYLSGPTLSSRIRSDGPLTSDAANSVALQLCSALKAAHAAGVIHRDFKSGNIMLDSGDSGAVRAVVTDFGLARDARPAAAAAVGSDVTRPGMLVGTPAYMAPEQFEGRPVSPVTDIYALGVVLFEMVTGHLPFTGDSPIAAAVQRGKQAPAVSSVRPGLDLRWDAVIRRCLEYEPERRFQTADEVAEALQSKPTALRKMPLMGRPRFAAVVLVFALAFGGFYWYRSAHKYHPPASEVKGWYDMGTAALREGTYLKAATALERATELDKRFVLAHARLADAWTELDFTDKAKNEMLEASAPELSRDLPAIDKEYVEAVRATITRDFPAAVERYKVILAGLPETEKAYGLVDLGRAYEKAGKIDEAIKNYSAAAKLAGEYPASFVRLGALQSRQKHANQGDAAFMRAESLYAASSNREGLAEVDYQRGLAASEQGRLDVARSYTEKALADAHSIPSVQLEIRALLLLSGIDHRSGDLDRAGRFAARAIQLARDNGIAFWSTQGLVQLGNPYLKTGDYAKAESYFQEALTLARKNGSRRLEAMAQLSLASVRSQQVRPDDVIPLAQSALDFYRDGGFVTQANSALTLITRARRDKGDLPGALQAFNDQLAIGRKARDPGMTALAEEGVGGILQRLERYPEALNHFEAALDAGKESGSEFVALQAIHCADALANLGRYGEAEAMLQKAAPMTKTHPALIAEITRVSAAAALSQGRNGRALDLSRQVLRSKQPRSSAAESDLSIIECQAQVRLGSTRAGETLCREAITRARSDPNSSQVPSASLALAEASLATNSLREAQLLAQTAANDFHTTARRESEWRSLLLLARIYRTEGDLKNSTQSALQALDILNALDHNWETVNSESYRNRPDVQAARRKLVNLLFRK